MFGPSSQVETDRSLGLRAARRGVTLMESIAAVSITTIAGAAMLTSVSAAIRSSSDTTYTFLARGLAQQLMDEIAAVRFPPATASPPASTANRIQFDDIDDYDGWSSPSGRMQLRNGEIIGEESYKVDGRELTRPTLMQIDPTFLSQFRREVNVERVQSNGSGGWTVVTQHTNYRRVTVTTFYTDGNADTRPLAVLTRILSYARVAP